MKKAEEKAKEEGVSELQIPVRIAAAEVLRWVRFSRDSCVAGGASVVVSVVFATLLGSPYGFVMIGLGVPLVLIARKALKEEERLKKKYGV